MKNTQKQTQKTAKTILTRIPAALLIAATTLLPVATNDAFAWGRFDGGIHPAHPGTVWHRPNPVIVHRTYIEHRSGGCAGCGAGIAAVAGLVGGAIIGAAIASNSPPPAPTYIAAAPPPPVIIQQQPIIMAQPTYIAQTTMPIGTEVAALPPGCVTMNVNGATYYQCGPTWYQPFFGGNQVYYTVVPTP